MRRRDLLTYLGGAAVAVPLAARAQQKAMPVIGLLSSGSLSAEAKLLAAFREALGEAGYIEGRNVLIEYRWADGQYDRLPALAADLVARRAAVIAAMSAPTVLPAKAATATIPIVFYGGFDPVERGLVKSLAHPGGNVTGVSAFVNKLNPKRVELLHQLVPNAEVFGLLVNPQNPDAERQSRETREAARTLGLQMLVENASSDDALPRAFARLAEKAGGLILGGDPRFGNRRERIVELAVQNRLPAIYYDRRFVDAGGLISYGDSFVDTWRLVGVYVGKILKGAKPADLPVQQPTRFELVINLKTAKALGLTVPQSLFARADEVIE